MAGLNERPRPDAVVHVFFAGAASAGADVRLFSQSTRTPVHGIRSHPTGLRHRRLVASLRMALPWQAHKTCWDAGAADLLSSLAR